ncbi:Polysulfide reductase, subunit A, putative [hydrothermal vent metagenome]|uniref:Polysulfide reductase, subunit A, putative n=1 Tax=hydrothermal vent metagenome TaxID=652676 RepID=A0A3B0S0W6_9ZZZZ
MFSRRELFKVGALAASSLAVSNVVLANPPKKLIIGGKDFSRRTGLEREMKPSACWQCVSRCPNVGYVEDGRLVKIEGQINSIRTHGLVCAKGQAGVNQSNDPDRILYPLRRTGKRGEGKWKRVSWDEALSEISDRLMKLKEQGHPEKFMFQYGRMKASSSKIIKQFLAAYGTGTIGNHTTICEGGKWTAQEFTWGKHYDNWDFDNTRFVLNFGSNLFEAHTNHVSTAHRLVNAINDRGVRVVTFDVRLSNTVSKSAEWVPVKPGTDLAVVLAMCNVIMMEDLYKLHGEEFFKFCRFTKDVNATTKQKVDALKAHLKDYTPEWAEQQSGVDADKTRELARTFATMYPAVVISYRGAVAHHNGHDCERAIQMLASITGNIDVPGGRCHGVGPHWKYPHGASDLPKAKKLDILDGLKGDVAFPNHHVSHQVFDVIADGSQGRPEIYMWYCYQPVYSNPQTGKNIEVLKDEKLLPFTIAVSPFYDESSALADIILPDATYTERWDWEDMVSPTQVPEYYIRQPFVQPPGEVRDFKDVAIELAERIGKPLGYKSAREFVQLSCEMTPDVKKAGGFSYMTKHGVYVNPDEKPHYYGFKKKVPVTKVQSKDVVFDEKTNVYWNWKKAHVHSRAEALKTGYTNTKKAYKGYIGQKINGEIFVAFPPDKINKTGYLELYSELMEGKGFAPMPTWHQVPEHKNMAENEMILTTYKVNVQSHSRTQNSKWLTEIYHENPAWVNPDTAAKFGIGEGDKIEIQSVLGKIETVARVTPAVFPGVISISNHCGHWEYGRIASGKPTLFSKDDEDYPRKWWKNNGVHPNWIIPSRPDPVNGQQRWMDTVVKVTKI